nr:hypothetical protein [Cryobacterium sp. Y50]
MSLSKLCTVMTEQPNINDAHGLIRVVALLPLGRSERRVLNLKSHTAPVRRCDHHVSSAIAGNFFFLHSETRMPRAQPTSDALASLHMEQTLRRMAADVVTGAIVFEAVSTPAPADSGDRRAGAIANRATKFLLRPGPQLFCSTIREQKEVVSNKTAPVDQARLTVLEIRKNA